MTSTEDEEQPQTTDLTPSETVEAQPKKSCKEKSKKCMLTCFLFALKGAINR